ncbi:MAG: hypothetical protein AABZ78_03695, partial [Chloroflexota bacterium]
KRHKADQDSNDKPPINFHDESLREDRGELYMRVISYQLAVISDCRVVAKSLKRLEIAATQGKTRLRGLLTDN